MILTLPIDDALRLLYTLRLKITQDKRYTQVNLKGGLGRLYVKYDVEHRRQPGYYPADREFAERCMKWRKRCFPDSDITWIEKA